MLVPFETTKSLSAPARAGVIVSGLARSPVTTSKPDPSPGGADHQDQGLAHGRSPPCGGNVL
jgi:hypothetical protein